jgi:hypothetical protein
VWLASANARQACGLASHPLQMCCFIPTKRLRRSVSTGGLHGLPCPLLPLSCLLPILLAGVALSENKHAAPSHPLYVLLQYSPDLRDLVKSLLSKNPKMRPSTDAILAKTWLKEYVARARDKVRQLGAAAPAAAGIGGGGSSGALRSKASGGLTSGPLPSQGGQHAAPVVEAHVLECSRVV